MQGGASGIARHFFFSFTFFSQFLGTLHHGRAFFVLVNLHSTEHDYGLGDGEMAIKTVG
jgi:hypothetical protein